MRKMFYFKCGECGLTEEHMVSGDKHPKCSECNGFTERLIGAPKFCGNTTGRSPAITTKAMTKPFG